MWEYRAACLHVIDGDTIRVLADTGFGGRHEVDVRLLGVSAPELSELGGAETRGFIEIEWMGLLQHGLRWPLLIRTSITTTPEPSERRTFIRYLADVTDITSGASLNKDLADYLAEHPEWGSAVRRRGTRDIHDTSS